MKLLITGSVGFIGRHAVKAALARGWDVDGFDVRHPSGNRRMDVRLLSRIEADVVLHLAAYSSNAGFADALAENYANNVMGTWNVLRVAQKCGARVLYASSSAVYGSNDIHECLSESEPAYLDDLQSHYGRSKLINEIMALSFPRTLGLRIFNAYGSGDELKPADRQAPPTWMAAAKRAGKPAVIFGDGAQAKDFIHVSDVAEIMCRLIESDASGVVNVGTGVAKSFNDLARMIGCKIEYAPVPDAASYQWFTRADTERLHSMIGAYGFVGVKEGLRL